MDKSLYSIILLQDVVSGLRDVNLKFEVCKPQIKLYKKQDQVFFILLLPLKIITYQICYTLYKK